MVALTTLWLPILLSAVGVFVVSSVIHMLLKYHVNDFRPLPDENAARAAIGPLAIPPGEYAVPRASSMKEMGEESFRAKLAEGPVAFLTVLPNGQWKMGASLVQWFVYSLVVSVFAAYVAGQALPRGAEYMQVFQFTGATAFFCYAVGLWQNSIWYKRSWSTTLKSTFDGLVYGLVTAGFFGWLWPGA